jgi:hypothetical protein
MRGVLFILVHMSGRTKVEEGMRVLYIILGQLENTSF